jgi:tRNA G18 (ribose-2'-O)-methylase SpoU
MPQPFTLIGLDIEGDWNRPLLVNAAALAGCECIFASSGASEAAPSGQSAPEQISLERALEGYRHVLACESIKASVSIYDLPAPREKTAILVGNEVQGIPRQVLKRVHRVVSVPMVANELSSLNVAVAAAITLYGLTHDLARKRRVPSNLRRPEVDLLIAAPPDPNELGSLLRSAYAFGWRRAFVSDPHRVWFSGDQGTILKSRAAARRAKNPLVVAPAEKLDLARYDAVLACDLGQSGSPLSRLRLPECRRLLVVVGNWELTESGDSMVTRVAIDHADRSAGARFRHDGSIFLSLTSQLLRS